MSTYQLLINGKLVDGDATLDVLNPATEEVFATCSRGSEEQLNQAVAAAKGAFDAWSEKSIDERKQVVLAMADVLEANAEELAQILVQEQGKPLADATGEVYGTAAFFRYFTTLNLDAEVMEDSDNRKVEAHRKPLGVVGAILPWNFPLLLLGFKLPSALIAGNTVVVKPAPTTPLATLRMGELLKDTVPAGVINIVADANDLGGALTMLFPTKKFAISAPKEDPRLELALLLLNLLLDPWRFGAMRFPEALLGRSSHMLRSS